MGRDNIITLWSKYNGSPIGTLSLNCWYKTFVVELEYWNQQIIEAQFSLN